MMRTRLEGGALDEEGGSHRHKYNFEFQHIPQHGRWMLHGVSLSSQLCPSHSHFVGEE